MSITATESLPKHEQFLIGRTERRTSGATSTASFDSVRAIVQRSGYLKGAAAPYVHTTSGPRLLHCLIRNDGANPFTLQVEMSANNNLANVPGQPSSADAYADKPIRVEGATVANGELIVAPGAQAVFAIEWTLAEDDYLRFVVAAEDATGELTLAHYEGLLVRREGVATP